MHNAGEFDWNDLRYFLGVAREGSTLAAAKVLRVNPSTVQRRLMELERRLGCKLLQRHPSGYRLTGFGKELRPYAERVEQHAKALQRRASALDNGEGGSIRLTCSAAVARRLMQARLLDAFHEPFANMRIELLMTERVVDLSLGEADIAIRGGASKDRNLFGKKIADVPWGIYASRSYLDRCGRPRHPEDVVRHSIIEFVGDIADVRAARWLPSKAPGARVAAQSGNILGVLMAVKSGVGLAPLPVPLAELEENLVRVFGPLPELSYPMFLLVHRDLRDVPRFRAFLDYCGKELRPVLAGEVD